MVDKAKRNTLKNVAGIGVGTIAMATSTGAFSQLHNLQNGNSSAAASLSQTDLADIQVSTRISSQANELEVVLTNVGEVPANMTDMTPAVIDTARGRFDFDALFADGNVHLAVGESVSVPMQHHTVVMDGSSIGKRSVVLRDALRQNISIVTDGDSLAAVDIVNSIAAA